MFCSSKWLTVGIMNVKTCYGFILSRNYHGPSFGLCAGIATGCAASAEESKRSALESRHGLAVAYRLQGLTFLLDNTYTLRENFPLRFAYA